MSPKILVLGSSGQVGRALLERGWSRPGDIIPMDRAGIDLSLRGQAKDVIESIKPDVVINAAAYTAVDKAETEPDLAFAVNSDGPEEIAEATAALKIPVLHFSTDYVFDGKKKSPYIETDAVRPVNVYGASKAQGEIRLRNRNHRHLIVRTSWIYSRTGNNFARTIFRLAQERSELRVVDDQIGAPTSAVDIASAIMSAVAGILDDENLFGTYHLSASGATSWYGFAEAILAGMRTGSGRRPVLVPIPTSDYPTLAQRPANSLLACNKFLGAFGFALPDWKESLMPVLSFLNADKT